jgi:FxLD family lantipeptide
MHTANPTGTHGDPFDLDAVLVIDTAAANGPRRCDTSDGCAPTCASSCTSASQRPGRLRLATYIRLQAGPHIAEIIETFEREHSGASVSFDHDNSYLDNLRRGRWDVIVARLPLTDPDVTVGRPVQGRRRQRSHGWPPAPH